MLLPYAFIRLFIAFAIGIVAGTYMPAFHTESTIFVFIAILAYLCLHLFTNNTFKRKNAFALAVVATVLTALFGYVYTLHRTAKFDPKHLLVYKDSLQYYEVELTSELKKTSRGDKAEATVLRVCTDTAGQQWQYATGKVMLYFEELAKGSIPIDYGTRLIVKGFPTDIPSPMNPDEFDYHNYMSNLQIYHYQFLHLRDYRLIDRSTPNWLQYGSIAARKYCDNIFKTYIKEHESYGLAAA
jgi:competence protein ComEC